MSLPPSGPDGGVAINPAREFLFSCVHAFWAITPCSFISKDLLDEIRRRVVGGYPSSDFQHDPFHISRLDPP